MLPASSTKYPLVDGWYANNRIKSFCSWFLRLNSISYVECRQTHTHTHKTTVFVGRKEFRSKPSNTVNCFISLSIDILILNLMKNNDNILHNTTVSNIVAYNLKFVLIASKWHATRMLQRNYIVSYNKT